MALLFTGSGLRLILGKWRGPLAPTPTPIGGWEGTMQGSPCNAVQSLCSGCTCHTHQSRATGVGPLQRLTLSASSQPIAATLCSSKGGHWRVAEGIARSDSQGLRFAPESPESLHLVTAAAVQITASKLHVGCCSKVCVCASAGQYPGPRHAPYLEPLAPWDVSHLLWSAGYG